MNNEIWKPVKDFEDRYEVSSCGRVRDIAMSKIMNIRKDAYIPLHDQKNKTKKIKIYKIVATVLYHKRDNGWLAKWLDDDGIQRSKTFNCEIYGSEEAKQMAIDCRKQMEEKYNNN